MRAQAHVRSLSAWLILTTTASQGVESHEKKLAASAIAVTAALLLTGCGNLPEQRASTPTNSASYPANTPYNTSSNTSYYGVVDSIQLIPGEPASGGPGVGAIVGGVVGGILGNQAFRSFTPV